jgi:predicted transcriptional regulator of viral defense system
MNKKSNLSKTDTEIIETLLHSKKELFTNSDLNRLLYKGEASSVQIFKLIDRLINKNWLQRIERGKYLLKNVSSGIQYNPFIIGMQLVQSSAVAYWSALNYYGLTEQIPKTTFIQTTKRKISGQIQNTKYVFVTVNKHKFFGLRKEWIQHLSFQITDLEKTLVDCFDYPEYSGGIVECAKGFLNATDINPIKLVDYSLKMKNSAILKRIGYIAELFGLDSILEQFTKKEITVSPKYSLLDTSLPNQGHYVSKWRLRINLDVKQLKQNS